MAWQDQLEYFFIVVIRNNLSTTKIILLFFTGIVSSIILRVRVELGLVIIGMFLIVITKRKNIYLLYIKKYV